MRFKVTSKELQRALAAIAPAHDKRSFAPILKCVRVDASPGEVYLTATDGTTFASYRLDATATVGSTCVNLESLRAALKAEAGDVTVEHDAKTTLRVSGQSHARLDTFATSGFPESPVTRKLTSVDLAALATMAKDALPFASNDGVRYQLAGVLFTRFNDFTDGGQITARMVATDGHRLIKRNALLGWTVDRDAIMPRRFVALLSKMRGDVGMAGQNDKGAITVSADGSLLICARPVDATFPPYDQVIPSDPTRIFRVTTDDLRNLITAVTPPKADKNPMVALHATKDVLRAACIVKSDDGSQEIVYAIPYTGANNTLEGPPVCLNPHYLKDAVAVAVNDRFYVGLSGALDPIVLMNGNSTIVIMPMRGGKDVIKLAATADVLPVSEAPAPAALPPADVPQAARKSKSTRKVFNATEAAQVGLAMVDAFRALHPRLLPCYRCGADTRMGYVLDGLVCCRECRGAHREAYYAGRGKVAPERRDHRRGTAIGGKVGHVVIHAGTVQVMRDR